LLQSDDCRRTHATMMHAIEKPVSRAAYRGRITRPRMKIHVAVMTNEAAAKPSETLRLVICLKWQFLKGLAQH
jgi:hypothetical protein